MEPSAETELLERCCRGEAVAWERLFDEHYGAVGRFLFQLAPELTAADIEELCQEVFLAAIQHLAGFQRNSRLQTWLFRIAANKAADHRTRLSAAKRGSGQIPISLQAEGPSGNPAPDPPSPLPGPDDLLLLAERRASIYRALSHVGAPCRELIELRYFADLSYDEIGLALGLNLKTVSSRLSRCLDRLEGILRSELAGEDLSRFAV